MNKHQLKAHLQDLLFTNTERFWINLYHHKYQQLLDELCEWPLLMNKPETEPLSPWLLLHSISFIRHKIEQQQAEISQLRNAYQLFMTRLSKSEIDYEKQQHILNYAETLGATAKQLKADKAAFARWFDEGAMRDRYQSKVAEIEQGIKFLIARLGTLSKNYLAINHAQLEQTWRTLDLQPFFLSLLEQNQTAFIRHSIIRALVNQVALIQEHNIDTQLSSELIARLVELLDDEQTPYTAIIDILEILIHQRPTFVRGHMWAALFADEQQIDNNQLFILAALPRVITQQQNITAKDITLLEQLSEHDYPRVRQALIEQTASLPDDIAKTIILDRFANEQVDAVRFTLIKQLTAERFCEDLFAFELWQQTLFGQYTLPIKRIALEQSARIMLNMQLNQDSENAIFERFINVLNKVLLQTQPVAVKRYITRTREQLTSFYNQALIADINTQLAYGNTVLLPNNSTDQHTLGRALSFLAQQRVGFNGKLSRGKWHIHEGYNIARRLWRVVHELCHSSTDKRPGFSHTTARKPSAQLHVPSCTVAEISETNVPGEPLYHLHEHSARPYLPLLDYILSILSQDQLASPVFSYSPDGILEITKPASFTRRIYAYCYISLHFQQLDNLRKGGEFEQQKYLNELVKLGFKIQFKAYGNVLNCAFPVEPGIESLFSHFRLAPSVIAIWSSFKEYAYSVYQNTLSQLVFFVVSFSAYFWGRHLYISRKIIRNRQAIAVSIGGWGTRGKSGTERLKAALFSALALRCITKTTGCEAMMIYCKITGEQYEVPIFRPFNKATIWEQSDVLEFAKSVNADVFLWECMGLTPRYVKILRRWMKDNFITITNAYPDHEDILGPSGVDVAREMSAFIGEDTQVFTSEQTMAPFLESAAKEKNSTLIQVHWGDGFQITPDIRALYPYDEHPDNIALVCKMAQYIGINKDFVFKATAERIVPDIGVLQHFFAAKVGDLSQSFVNSMSANERLATIENWQRLELFKMSEQPHVQTIALINNREDRVARSKVFANIMAEDLCFDHIVVVGSNVGGFASYLKEAVKQRIIKAIENKDKKSISDFITQIKLNDDIASLLAAMNISLQTCPLTITQVSSYEALEQALCSNNELCDHQKSILLKHYSLWQKGQAIIAIDDLTAHANNILQTCLSLLNSKLVLIEDVHISSNSLTQTIAKLGCKDQHQLIVGMQNIKGVGISYVQSWQQWQKTQKVCEQLLDPKINSTEFRQALNLLAHQTNFNLLEVSLIAQTAQALLSVSHAQSELSQAELQILLNKLADSASEKHSNSKQKAQSPVKQFFYQVIESFLEAGAAVKRKKLAQQVYKDIASQHITIERATDVLSRLSQSQKSGWLIAKQKKR
ncbi:poly-gamma-glutamate synthase PgsB [Pseudoalteromonas sp. JBTF-M23]|uniref:Poly-gamma-glutamate synthase PgsB n=1 Tax=Pseudoalteromonas caenipelagi TaxID=2726988 RepID=A0A849VGQ3_9GAMM|nr:poly-gamma-glutamate synthase PgsB [Pseudoalteromonas caenipelagi]NOU52445.1 poly-gamma-glutamate synthase PgsB [Pseudoalteromonas caenipelagi]